MSDTIIAVENSLEELSSGPSRPRPREELYSAPRRDRQRGAQFHA